MLGSYFAGAQVCLSPEYLTYNMTETKRRLERRWEDLNIDCLSHIFRSVGLKTLAIDLPLVCKSWYKATQISDCWKSLDFEDLYCKARCHYKGPFRFSDLIRFVVDRSHGTAIECGFHHPEDASDLQDLHYIVDRSPSLRSLKLPGLWTEHCPELLKTMIGKLKDLEMLELAGSEHLYHDYPIEGILRNINIHCKNFATLTIAGKRFHDKEASTIVGFMPNIKCLVLKWNYIDRENLKCILAGCLELEKLDVRYCEGFYENDQVILKMASHIKNFNSKGAYINDDYTDYIDDDSVDSSSDIGIDDHHIGDGDYLGENGAGDYLDENGDGHYLGENANNANNSDDNVHDDDPNQSDDDNDHDDFPNQSGDDDDPNQSDDDIDHDNPNPNQSGDDMNGVAHVSNGDYPIYRGGDGR